MVLEGAIKDFSIPDTLQFIAAQKKTGVLTLSQGKETVQITFVHGSVIKGYYGEEDEQISDMLIMAEKITIIQLRTALHTRPKGASLATTFLELGYLTGEGLKTWNQTLTQETIVSLLFWESGDYRFEAQDIHVDEAAYPPMGIEHLLEEGMRQKEEWPKLLSQIPSRDIIFSIVDVPQEQGVMSAATSNENDLSDLDTEEHLWLLQWIDGGRTVGGIVNHTGVGAFAVYKCLIELLAIGKIREKQKIKTPRNFFPLFSVKHLAFSPLLLNGLLITFVIAGFMMFLTPSFFRGSASDLPPEETPHARLARLIIIHQKDRLEFALNLYHLRYGYYPLDFNRLSEEGFIGPRDDLQKFSYHSDGKTFELVLTP